MSYTIEYSGEVYKEPAEWNNSSENSYLLILTQGDNNVYEASNSRRARSRNIITYGWKYSIIQKVCERAGYCEGGSLQPNGRYTTPELYLKKYRDKIKNAPLITEFFNSRPHARFELRIGESTYDQELLVEMKDYIHEEIGYYSKEKELWAEIDITDRESFDKFRKLWNCAKYHNCIHISGGD